MVRKPRDNSRGGSPLDQPFGKDEFEDEFEDEYYAADQISDEFGTPSFRNNRQLKPQQKALGLLGAKAALFSVVALASVVLIVLLAQNGGSGNNELAEENATTENQAPSLSESLLPPTQNLEDQIQSSPEPETSTQVETAPDVPDSDTVIDYFDEPEDLGAIIELSKRSIVEVWCETNDPSYPYHTGTGWPLRVGNEVLFVTNHHVIDGCDTPGRTFVELFIGDSEENGYYTDAEVISHHESKDLALLRSDYESPPFIPSLDIKAGYWALSVGNGAGYLKSVDKGYIRNLVENNTSFSWTGPIDVIIHTASIHVGDSGGPLFNSSGEVIGINFAGDDDSENTFFAIYISELCAELLNCSTDPWTLR